MEEIVLADEENPGKLLVVVCHHDVLGRLLAVGEERVDIFDAAEGLLPEFEFHGNVELLEAGFQVTLQGLRLAEVDGMRLRRVLGGGLNMVAKQLAQAAELGLPGVLEAEVEGLAGRVLVEQLQASIVSQNVEDGSVCLPEELEPRRDNGTVGSVPGLFSGDGREKDGLGGFARLQVIDTVDGRLDFICLLLGRGNLGLGKLDEFFQDGLGAKYPESARCPAR